MRVLKRALAIVYLAAAIVALGTLVCQFWGPYTYRFMLLMRDPMPRIVVTACGGVVAIGVLVSFFRLMFARREPSCVHPAGERNIEVTLAALSSCARAAAERDDRVMIEHVEARVQGSDESRVRFKVDAIALDDKDVASLATCDAAAHREGLRHHARHAGHDRARPFFAVQDYRPDRGGFR